MSTSGSGATRTSSSTRARAASGARLLTGDDLAHYEARVRELASARSRGVDSPWRSEGVAERGAVRDVRGRGDWRCRRRAPPPTRARRGVHRPRRPLRGHPRVGPAREVTRGAGHAAGRRRRCPRQDRVPRRRRRGARDEEPGHRRGVDRARSRSRRRRRRSSACRTAWPTSAPRSATSRRCTGCASCARPSTWSRASWRRTRPARRACSTSDASRTGRTISPSRSPPRSTRRPARRLLGPTSCGGSTASSSTT